MRFLRSTGGAIPSIRLLLMSVVLLAIVHPLVANGQELTIAAASDLNFAMKELAVEFEKTTGVPVKLSLGSSGSMFMQIQNGAPFDLYFSANMAFPKKLEETGAALSGSIYTYAVGRVVVWAPSRSPVDVERLGMDVLLDPSIKKIAIANPKHAPYGRAAVAALEHFKIYDRVRDKLVFGENAGHAAQFVESGACDIGLIALSLAMVPSMKAGGKYWEIPSEAHPPLEQGAVILKGTKHPDAAKTFVAFLQGVEGQHIMRRYGFRPPDQTSVAVMS